MNSNQPKFKAGDIIKYRGNIYLICSIEFFANTGRWMYNVQMHTWLDDDDENRVTAIGTSAEDDMTFVDTAEEEYKRNNNIFDAILCLINEHASEENKELYMSWLNKKINIIDYRKYVRK